jgi:hypothetical protein
MDDPKYMRLPRKKQILPEYKDPYDLENKTNRKNKIWNDIMPQVNQKITDEILQNIKNNNQLISLAKEVIWNIGRMVFDVNNFQRDLEANKINTQNANIFIQQLKKYSMV